MERSGTPGVSAGTLSDETKKRLLTLFEQINERYRADGATDEFMGEIGILQTSTLMMLKEAGGWDQMDLAMFLAEILSMTQGKTWNFFADPDEIWQGHKDEQSPPTRTKTRSKANGSEKAGRRTNHNLHP